MATVETGSISLEQERVFIEKNSRCYAGFDGISRFATEAFPELETIIYDSNQNQIDVIYNPVQIGNGVVMKLIDEHNWSGYKVSTIQLDYPETPETSQLIDVMCDASGYIRFFDRINQNGAASDEVRSNLLFRFSGLNTQMDIFDVMITAYTTELEGILQEFKPNYGDDYFFNKPLSQNLRFNTYGPEVTGRIIGINKDFYPIVYTQDGKVLAVNNKASINPVPSLILHKSRTQELNDSELIKKFGYEYKQMLFPEDKPLSKTPEKDQEPKPITNEYLQHILPDYSRFTTIEGEFDGVIVGETSDHSALLIYTTEGVLQKIPHTSKKTALQSLTLKPEDQRTFENLVRICAAKQNNISRDKEVLLNLSDYQSAFNINRMVMSGIRENGDYILSIKKLPKSAKKGKNEEEDEEPVDNVPPIFEVKIKIPLEQRPYGIQLAGRNSVFKLSFNDLGTVSTR